MSSAPADLETFVRLRFGDDATTEALAGDASGRRYFRVRPRDGHPCILMVLRERFGPPYLPFERMAGFLAALDFPVPRVLERHPEARTLVVEDLGDVSLQARLAGPAGGQAAEWRSLYEEAVDLIVRLQRVGTAAVGPDLPAYHFCLDAVKLRRELDYFREQYVQELLGGPLEGEDARLLERSLAMVAERAGRSGDRVLCHRDFHSRNLMLPPVRGEAPGRLAMLDFQDARLGPRAYDLASLLCDAYLEVPPDLAEEMTARFLRGINHEHRAGEFAVDYAWVAVQRTLKALGTFAGQATRFGNDTYLPYVPRALARARESLAPLPEMSSLGDLLTGPLDFRDPGLPDSLR